MTVRTNVSLSIFMLLVIFLSACHKNRDSVVNPKSPGAGEQELITTLVLNCVSSQQDTIQARFKDGDGMGGNEWSLDSLVLKANTTYKVRITLLNESQKGKVIDMTKEIEEEKDYHQFFFENPGLEITTAYVDKDSKGLPVGLRFSLTTANSSQGIFRVKLSHFSHDQVKDGITPKGGTDIYVEFPAKIR